MVDVEQHSRHASAHARNLRNGSPTLDSKRSMTPQNWRGSAWKAGALLEALDSHERLAAHEIQIEAAARSAQWELRPANLDERGKPFGLPLTPDEQALHEAIEQALQLACTTFDASRPRGSWRGWLGQSFTWRRLVGAHVSEYTWHTDWCVPPGRDGQRLRLELYQIHPGSWDRWIPDPANPNSGAYTHLRQRTADGASQDIPRERLIHLPYRATPGLHEGRSLVRSALVDILIANEAKKGHVRTIKSEGPYLKVRETGGGDSVRNRPVIEQLIKEGPDGEPIYWSVPGYDVDVDTTTGTGTSPVEFLRYVDEQIDRLMGSWLATLGGDNGGAYALGKQLEARDNHVFREALCEYGEAVSRELFPVLARDLGFSATYRWPTLWVPEAESVGDPLPLLNALQAASTAGAIDPTLPKTRQHIARMLGLPDDAVAEQMAPKPQPVRPALPLPGQPLAPMTPVAPAAPGVAKPAPMLAAHDCGPGCAHDLTAADMMTDTGADGRQIPWQLRRSLYDAERTVAWADNEDEAQAIREQMQREINAEAEVIEQAVFAAMVDGILDVSELSEIEAEHIPRIEAIVMRAVTAQAEAVRRQSDGERRRQSEQSIGVSSYDPAPILGQWAQRQLDIAMSEAQLAAKAIVQRVTSAAAAEAVAPGFDPATYVPQRTESSLAYEAAPAVNRTESVGRVASGALSPPEGYRIGSLIRTGVRNANQCDVCDPPVDGKRWTFTSDADVEAFIADPDAMTPDPRCKGRKRCRCGFTVVWVRIDG